MNISTSAKTYANSLIDLPNENVTNNLNLVAEVLSESKDFAQTMENPTISNETKYEIINEIFKDKLDNRIINFLKILIDKKKFNELNEIIQAYNDKSDELNGVKRANIISAVELSEEQKEAVVNKLQQRFEKTIIPSWLIDQEIIGGLVIKVDDDVIDNSLRNKLDKISKI